MSEFDEWMGKKCSVIQSAYGEEYTAAQEAWDFQQVKIDELQAYINKAQRCLPYYLLDEESSENWIGGVQTKIIEGEVIIDELQVRIDVALKQLDLAYPESWGCCVEQTIDILKGNKYE